jgi:hypothetical protein
MRARSRASPVRSATNRWTFCPANCAKLPVSAPCLQINRPTPVPKKPITPAKQRSRNERKLAFDHHTGVDHGHYPQRDLPGIPEVGDGGRQDRSVSLNAPPARTRGTPGPISSGRARSWGKSHILRRPRPLQSDRTLRPRFRRCRS